MNLTLARILPAFLLSLVLSACNETVKVDPVPERIIGINAFVAVDVVPESVKGRLVGVPNPLKAFPLDEEAETATQNVAATYGTAFREALQPALRNQGFVAYSYIAGANYRWDEIRRDERNYTLIAWPLRTTASEQVLDVKLVLIHVATGRTVWSYYFRDPYRMRHNQTNEAPHATRAQIVNAMCNEIVEDMKKHGIRPGTAR